MQQYEYRRWWIHRLRPVPFLRVRRQWHHHRELITCFLFLHSAALCDLNLIGVLVGRVVAREEASLGADVNDEGRCFAAKQFTADRDL